MQLNLGMTNAFNWQMEVFRYQQTQYNPFAGVPRLYLTYKHSDENRTSLFFLGCTACVAAGWLVTPAIWCIPIYIHEIKLLLGSRVHIVGLSCCMTCCNITFFNVQCDRKTTTRTITLAFSINQVISRCTKISLFHNEMA